ISRWSEDDEPVEDPVQDPGRGRPGDPVQDRSAEQQAAAPPLHPPEKAGWLRRFCGRGLFRELWRSRFVSLRGEHLLLSDQEVNVGSEVRSQRGSGERVDLLLYDRSEETRSSRRRSKKDLSRFSLIGCPTAGPTVPHLVFLAVSPEEKESWINHLNAAILRAKSHMLDQVRVEEQVVLLHPNQRPRPDPSNQTPFPVRGHLLKCGHVDPWTWWRRRSSILGVAEVKVGSGPGTDASQLRPSPRGRATGSCPEAARALLGAGRARRPLRLQDLQTSHAQTAKDPLEFRRRMELRWRSGGGHGVEVSGEVRVEGGPGGGQVRGRWRSAPSLIARDAASSGAPGGAEAPGKSL
ncbi:unnamed protein product, partial [Gadus morhua 'NCC']